MQSAYIITNIFVYSIIFATILTFFGVFAIKFCDYMKDIEKQFLQFNPIKGERLFIKTGIV